MKTFFALFIARNREFFRDRASLSWSLLFPILIIIGCALAFSGKEEQVLIVGVMGPHPDIALLKDAYAEVIDYSDQQQALTRLAHHQLHALIDTSSQAYWTNSASSRSRIALQLLQHQLSGFQQLQVEGTAIRYVDWVMPGVLGMNIMFASLFGVGYVIVRYRNNGVLKRLQATPVTALQFISAQLMSRLFIVIVANTVIFAGSNFFLNLTMRGSYTLLLLVAVLGALSMTSLGLVISARTASEEFAGGLVNMITWPMMFLSGVWFSLDNAPWYMQTLAQCLPLTHLVDAARKIMLEGASITDIWLHLVVLTSMTLVLMAIGALAFRWHKN
jgi:ABC-type multidrug transport system permease subunit